jgi:putative aldouronate transport system substrate-binding protein
LIDRDFSLYKDDNTMRNLIKSGVVGSFSQNWDEIYREPAGLLSDLQKNIPGAELVPVDCITSSDGITHKASYDAAGVYYFIPKAAKNPDAAMRYLNWLAKYENYHFIQAGPEGIVHTIVDGVPKLNASAGDGWIQNSAQNIDYTPMMNGMFLETQEASIRAIAAGYQWPADVVASAYALAMTNARPGIIVSTNTPLIEAAPISVTLQDKGVIFFSEVITAPASRFDAVYDAQLRDWLASGAQRVIDERAAKYVAP